MANDWIVWTVGLTRKPEVFRLARALDISRREAAAACMEMWEWADANTADGHAPGVTFVDLDQVIGVTGFGQALANVGWLEAEDEGVRFPNFDRWNTSPTKSRLRARERKRRERESRKGHAPTVTETRPQDKTRQDVTERDKRLLSLGFGESFSKNQSARFLENVANARQRGVPDAWLANILASGRADVSPFRAVDEAIRRAQQIVQAATEATDGGDGPRQRFQDLEHVVRYAQEGHDYLSEATTLPGIRGPNGKAVTVASVVRWATMWPPDAGSGPETDGAHDGSQAAATAADADAQQAAEAEGPTDVPPADLAAAREGGAP